MTARARGSVRNAIKSRAAFGTDDVALTPAENVITD